MLNDTHYFLMVLSLLISTTLMVIHFVYIKIKVKPSDAINRFLNAQLMIIFWGIFLLFKYIIPEYIDKSSISYLITISITFVGYQMTVVAYIYSYKKKITDKLSMLLIMIPFCCFLMYNMGVFINELLGDTLKIVSAISLIAYFLIGMVYFAYYMIRTNGLNHTKQSVYFCAVIGFDIYAHIIFYFDTKGVDNKLLIYFMPIYLLFLIGFTMKYQLYDKLPFVLDAIFHNSNQGIIVMNNYMKVIDFNKTFFKKYMDIDEIELLEELIKRMKDISDNKLSVDNILYAVKNVDKNHYSGDLKIHNGNRELFLIYTVNSICDDHNQKVANMIVFRDMTEMTCLQNGIHNKNNQLIRANNKLEEHMKNVQDLTVEKEREVLMTEINDTFGHSMTEILGMLEVSTLLLEQEDDIEVIEKAIDETTARARAALEQMRESVSRYNKEVTTND